MLVQVYKSTVRNLLRSGLLWMIILFTIGVNVYSGINGGYGGTRFHPENETAIHIDDNDPRYGLDYTICLKESFNSVAKTMNYSLPITVILTAVLILNRDHGDNFYEIEKASGVKPSTYILGRLFALLTVNFTIAIVLSLTGYYVFFAIRSPVTKIGAVYFITDSTVRVLRNVVFLLFPQIMLYVGLTFFFGCVFRSGIIASVISMAYMILCKFMDIGGAFKRITPKIYNDYFSPVPEKLMNYLYYYDSFSFESTVKSHSTSLGKAAFSVIFFMTVSFLFMFFAYFMTRKRDK